ncbi:MAG TPA: hypothetical protein VKM55_13670 [Candidatus Lokiarchaeia archaeon]|nr:hypothetical protein [Candidatus Lokiarchaeia archaeon]
MPGDIIIFGFAAVFLIMFLWMFKKIEDREEIILPKKAKISGERSKIVSPLLVIDESAGEAPEETSPHHVINLEENILFMALMPKSNIAACLLNSKIQTWDYISCNCIYESLLEGELTQDEIIAFSPNGAYMAYSWNYKITIVETSTWSAVFSIEQPDLSDHKNLTVYFTFTNDKLFVSAYAGRLMAWQVETWQQLEDVISPEKLMDVKFCNISQDGKLLFLRGTDKQTKVLDVRSGLMLALFEEINFDVTPDYLVCHTILLDVSGKRGKLQFRDRTSYQIVKDLHGFNPNSVSKDGTMIACDGKLDSVKRRDYLQKMSILAIPEGNERARFNAKYRTFIYGFSDNNDWIVGADLEGSDILVWNMEELPKIQ